MLTGGNSASSTPRTHNSRNQTSRARMVVKGVATGSSLVCLGLGDYPSLRCFRSRWRWWRQWRWVRLRRSRRRSLVRGGRYRDILTFSYKRCWHCRVWPSKSRRNRWRSRQLHRRQCPRNGAARRQSRTGAKDRHRKRSPDARHQCGRHRCFLGLFGRGCADRACRRDRKTTNQQDSDAKIDEQHGQDGGVDLQKLQMSIVLILMLGPFLMEPISASGKRPDRIDNTRGRRSKSVRLDPRRICGTRPTAPSRRSEASAGTVSRSSVMRLENPPDESNRVST
jgi:hypothetical protein